MKILKSSCTRLLSFAHTCTRSPSFAIEVSIAWRYNKQADSKQDIPTLCSIPPLSGGTNIDIKFNSINRLYSEMEQSYDLLPCDFSSLRSETHMAEVWNFSTLQ
jgi:hypothetical protein